MIYPLGARRESAILWNALEGVAWHSSPAMRDGSIEFWEPPYLSFSPWHKSAWRFEGRLAVPKIYIVTTMAGDVHSGKRNFATQGQPQVYISLNPSLVDQTPHSPSNFNPTTNIFLSTEGIPFDQLTFRSHVFNSKNGVRTLIF